MQQVMQHFPMLHTLVSLGVLILAPVAFWLAWVAFWVLATIALYAMVPWVWTMTQLVPRFRPISDWYIKFLTRAPYYLARMQYKQANLIFTQGFAYALHEIEANDAEAAHALQEQFN